MFLQPLFSGYALFEICSWKGSKTVIDAIVINFAKMAQVCPPEICIVSLCVCLLVNLPESVKFSLFLCLSPVLFLPFHINWAASSLTCSPSQALLLGLLFMYVWMVLGMMLLRQEVIMVARTPSSPHF